MSRCGLHSLRQLIWLLVPASSWQKIIIPWGWWRLCELFLGLDLPASATCRTTQNCYNLIHFLELILSLEWKSLEVTWVRHVEKSPLAWRNRENQSSEVGVVLSGSHCPKFLFLPVWELAASLLRICSCIFCNSHTPCSRLEWDQLLLLNLIVSLDTWNSVQLGMLISGSLDKSWWPKRTG